MEVEQRSISSIRPYPHNPRKNAKAVEAVARSIQEFGFRQPIVVDEEGVVIIGHTRLKAAKKLKLKTVPVHVACGLSPEKIKALRIADNKTGELAEWDTALLTAELTALQEQQFDLSSLGFSIDELAKHGCAAAPEGLTDPDDVPEPPAEPITKAGYLWILGEHRLLCGDSRKAEDVTRLMNGKRINVAFTSPPYASQRTYDETSGFRPIDPNDFVEWFAPVSANVKRNLAEDGSWFVNIKPACSGLSRLLYVFDLVTDHVRKWGWNFAEEFCWERSGIPQKVVRRFKNQFEPIYQFTTGEWKFRPTEVRHKSEVVPVPRGRGAGDTTAAKRQGVKSAVDGNELAEGLAYPGNRIPRFQSEALGHPAAFPVGVPSFFIKAFSDAHDVIYEPFCGSGSTLIAAEQLGRRCYGMEISPAYCDVIVQRWENFTGRKAEREQVN